MTAASGTPQRTRQLQPVLQLLEIVSDPAIIVVGGRTLAANMPFTALTGLTAGEVVGKPAEVLLARSTVPGVRREILVHVARSIPWSGTVSVSCAGHEELILPIRVSPMKADGEQAVFLVLASGHAPSPAELLEARRRLAAMHKLVGSVAHSLNNHMMVVQAHVDQALTSPLRVMLEPELVDVNKAARLAANLLVQLMGKGGQPDRSRERCNAADLVEAALQLTKGLIPPTVEIQTELDRNAGSIRIGNGVMEDIILNLATNARDAMPDGGCISVTVAPFVATDIIPCTTGDLKPRKYVRISVRDTGDGILPEVLPQVFKPFFTTKGDGDGFGIGLYSIRENVHRLGGCIDVDSSPGAGTLFDILIPAVP